MNFTDTIKTNFSNSKYINVTENPNFSMKDILDNPSYPWNWMEVSKHPRITAEDIDQHPNFPWNWMFVQHNPNIREWFALKYKDKLQFIHVLVTNPNISLEFITENYELDKYIGYIGRHPHVTMQYVFTFKELSWNWMSLFFNPSIVFCTSTFNSLYNYVKNNARCDYNILSTCKYLDLSTVIRDSDMDWSWFALSSNPDLTIDVLKALPNVNWSWPDVSKNPGISWEDIEGSLELPWDWNNVIMNPNVSLKHIKSRPDLPWNIDHFMINPNCTLDFIENTIECLQSTILSLAHNLTLDFILKYPDLPWNFVTLSSREFEHDPPCSESSEKFKKIFEKLNL